MVGTRTMTPYGGRMTNRLIADLAQMVPDLSVVSGLAFGVDGEAHLAALARHLGHSAYASEVG